MQAVRRLLICSVAILGSLQVLGGLPTPAQEPPLTFDPSAPLLAYEWGKNLYASGRYEDAINAFTTAIASSEKRCLAYANRGRSKLRLGQLDAAAADVAKALSVVDALINKDEGSASYYEQRAWAYIVQDELLVDRSRKESGNPPQLERRGDLNKASADLEKAVEIDPKRCKSLELLAHIQSVQQQWKKLLDTCDLALENGVDKPDFLIIKARAHLQLDECRQALEYCNRALENWPDSRGAYEQRARVFYVLQLWRNCRDDLDSAIKLDPGDVDLYLFRMLVHFRNSDSYEGMLDIERAIEHDPVWLTDKVVLTLYESSTLHCTYPLPGKSESDKLVPLEMSWTLPEGGMAILDRICAANSERGEGFLMRAWARVSVGNREGAWDDYQHALKLDLSPAGKDFADSVLEFYTCTKEPKKTSTEPPSQAAAIPVPTPREDRHFFRDPDTTHFGMSADSAFSEPQFWAKSRPTFPPLSEISRALKPATCPEGPQKDPEYWSTADTEAPGFDTAGPASVGSRR